MKINNRAQTATEFIILLALILLVAITAGLFLKNFVKNNELNSKIQAQIRVLENR